MDVSSKMSDGPTVAGIYLSLIHLDSKIIFFYINFFPDLTWHAGIAKTYLKGCVSAEQLPHIVIEKSKGIPSQTVIPSTLMILSCPWLKLYILLFQFHLIFMSLCV